MNIGPFEEEHIAIRWLHQHGYEMHTEPCRWPWQYGVCEARIIHNDAGYWIEERA